MLKQTDNWYQDTFILGTKTVYDSYRGMAKQIEDSRDLIATVRGADANIAVFERCSFGISIPTSAVTRMLSAYRTIKTGHNVKV